MEFTRIILKPYQTEKTYALQNAPIVKYSFVVDPAATKLQIALAFHTIYGKKPAKVATKMCKSVAVKTGTLHPGFSKKTKIAYITLAKGETLAPPVEEKKDKATPTVAKDVSKKEVTPIKTVAAQKVDVAKKEVVATPKDDKGGKN